MKILVVSQCFYPEDFRINDLCFELVARGHQVTVLTGYPNYPGGYIYPEYKKRRVRRETIQGVDVIRVRMVQRRKNPVSLFLNYVSYAVLASLRVARLDSDYDLIFVFEVSPVTQIIPAWRYKKKHPKAVLVVNCQDIWPEVVKVSGIREKSLLFSAIRSFSAKLYNRADQIVVSSPGFIEYLHRVCKIQLSRMSFLPNFAEDFYLDFDAKPVEDGKVHLLFAGNIGKAQSLDTIVEAVGKLPSEVRKKFIVDFLGDGSYFDKLKANVTEKHLEDSFRFHGRKPSEELRSYYEMASAFLLTLEGNSPVSLTIPAKLQGYMGAGKPVLAAIDGGAAEIIGKSNCSVCVSAGDSEGLSRVIVAFLKDPASFQKLGENGREYFKEHFTKTIYTDKLLNQFE